MASEEEEMPSAIEKEEDSDSVGTGFNMFFLFFCRLNVFYLLLEML